MIFRIILGGKTLLPGVCLLTLSEEKNENLSALLKRVKLKRHLFLAYLFIYFPPE